METPRSIGFWIIMVLETVIVETNKSLYNNFSVYDQVAVRESCYEVAMDPSDTASDVLYSDAADHCTGMNGILVEEENVGQVALLII